MEMDEKKRGLSKKYMRRIQGMHDEVTIANYYLHWCNEGVYYPSWITSGICAQPITFHLIMDFISKEVQREVP